MSELLSSGVFDVWRAAGLKTWLEPTSWLPSLTLQCCVVVEGSKFAQEMCCG